MATILEKIVADKYIEVDLLKQDHPLSNFKNDVGKSDRDFYGALAKSYPAYILECKPKSPSKGVINTQFDLTKIVKAYSPFATAISVLTDNKYFGGDYKNVSTARGLTHQPILCKDFIIDEYQIYFARLHGADAILLMLSVLNDAKYLALREVAHSLNLGVLTETSNEAELDRAIALNAKVIGINNRDLHTLTVDLTTTERLVKKVPSDRIVISESGISSHNDVERLASFAQGFLVGSHLVAAHNLDLAIRELIFGTHKVCGINSLDAAKAAHQAGAYYGGFIFVEKSPRYITPAQAQALKVIPLNYVGVFQNETLERVATTAKALSLKAVQLHGDESIEYIESLRAEIPETIEIFKAVDASTIKHDHVYFSHPAIDCIVLDYKQGGSGESFDWSLIEKLPKHRYLLAGGIGEHNIREALKQDVMGVDMNSALEVARGVKCPEKITAIFKNIREFIPVGVVKQDL